MDWFKVKVSYCLYTDLNDKQFGAYIKLMALTAQIETIPTQQQMLKVCHYKTLKTLQDYFKTRSTDLQDVLNKVLIDVQGVVNNRAASKARMQRFRGSKPDVTPNVIETERKREEKRRRDKIREDNNYNDVFNFYCSLDLINHKELTNDMKKAIDLAVRELHVDVDMLKTMLERHDKKVKDTAKTEYPTKKRPLAEFFGQKKYKSLSLVCTDYMDCAWEQYEAKGNKAESPQELLARLKAEGRI